MAVSPSQSDTDLLLLPPPPPPPPPSEAHSPLSSLVYEMSHKMQEVMENMLKMSNEIDENSNAIMEEIEKSKESALERKRFLEEEKERFQKAAYAALNMLNNGE